MLAIQKIKLGSTWICLILAAGLLTGCSSSSSSNKRVYDRYAALVAERSRFKQAETKPQKSSSARSADKSLNRQPIKPSSTTEKSTQKKTTPTKKSTAKSAPPLQEMTPAPVMPVEKSTAVSGGVSVPVDPVAQVAATDTIAGYRLKVGDGIQVFLRGIPAPDAIEDIIDEVGMIALPLINDVQAAGLTASELERRIRKMYLDEDIYRNISVNVVVPTRFYFIQGEIRAPGRFQIMSATRVSQAIAGAGGYTEYASGKVLVKRGGKIFKTIKNARRLERKPSDDIMLKPDDIVEVKRSLW